MGLSRRWTNFAFALGVFLHLPTVLASSYVQNESTGGQTDDQLRAKIGQLLFVGISDTTLSPRTKNDLKDLKPGAVILFKRNIASMPETSSLTRDLQLVSKHYSPQPMIIATDQEGGRVARIEMNPAMPSPLALGLTKDPKIVEAVSYETGRFLHYLGFNMNLAPVLDVLSSPGITFIGERSFGFSSKIVGELGLAFAQGQLRAGVLPTSKHFPGAGLMTKDPHVEKVSSSSFPTDSLEPFRQFSSVFPSAIMLSHSSYPSLDSSGLPATFSSKIVSDLLIHDIGYKGLIVTDDLRMGAAATPGATPQEQKKIVGELAIKSFLAGADLLMITWGPQEQRAARDALFDAVKSGKISMEALDARVGKIAQIKHLLAPLMRQPANLEKAGSLESKAMAKLDDLILQRNLNGEFQHVDRPKTSERFVVIGRTQQFRWGFERSLGHAVGSIFTQDFLKVTSGSPLEHDLLSKYDCMIFPIYSHKDAIFLNSVSKEIRHKTIAINFSSPGLVDENSLRGLINLFHPHVNAGSALGLLLRGPAGKVASEASQIAE